MKNLETVETLHTHTHTSIYLDNKNTELKDSLIVVPQNKKCGTTFLRPKLGNAGVGFSQIIYIVVAVILTATCIACIYLHNKNQVLNPIENSGEVLESGEIENAGKLRR